MPDAWGYTYGGGTYAAPNVTITTANFPPTASLAPKTEPEKPADDPLSWLDRRIEEVTKRAFG